MFAYKFDGTATTACSGGATCFFFSSSGNPWAFAVAAVALQTFIRIFRRQGLVTARTVWPRKKERKEGIRKEVGVGDEDVIQSCSCSRIR